MKQIMKAGFTNFLCMICASFVLVGCSYFDAPESPPDEVEAVDLMQTGPAYEPVSIEEVIARKTRGRVVMYSLDADQSYSGVSHDSSALDVAPVQATPKPGSMMPEDGYRVLSDPDVRIFPLP